MGWLTYKATCFKANGSVDRKAQMDRSYRPDEGRLKILKSVMKGSIYYAAVLELKKKKVVDGKTVYVDVPEEKRKIYGESYLTSVEHGMFSEKCMGDLSAAPDSILNLINTLSEEDKHRIETYREGEKRQKALSKFPVGTKISMICESFYSGRAGEDKPGDTITLVKDWCYTSRSKKQVCRWINRKQNYFVPQWEIPADYVVLP